MRTRGFEKLETYKDNEEIIIPKRSTKNSAAYDFFSPVDLTIPPKGKEKIKTGIKSYFLEDECLKLFPRSSQGIKNGIMLQNTVGIIDSDYYNNEDNEGEIIIALKNTSDKDFIINKGDKICQGMFQKILLADNDNTSEERKGGIGSTGK